MKAVAFHGKRDVRVDNVPDPTIQEAHGRGRADHLDRTLRIRPASLRGVGAFMDEGDILGHEPMGIVEAVGSEVTQIKPGDRVVIPFNISCGHCFMCDMGLFSQCETTQVKDQGKGAALLAQCSGRCRQGQSSVY